MIPNVSALSMALSQSLSLPSLQVRLAAGPSDSFGFTLGSESSQSSPPHALSTTKSPSASRSEIPEQLQSPVVLSQPKPLQLLVVVHVFWSSHGAPRVSFRVAAQLQDPVKEQLPPTALEQALAMLQGFLSSHAAPVMSFATGRQEQPDPVAEQGKVLKSDCLHLLSVVHGFLSSHVRLSVAFAVPKQEHDPLVAEHGAVVPAKGLHALAEVHSFPSSQSVPTKFRRMHAPSFSSH